MVLSGPAVVFFLSPSMLVALTNGVGTGTLRAWSRTLRVFAARYIITLEVPVSDSLQFGVPLEVERKFLVDPLVWTSVAKGRGQRFAQGYLNDDPARTVRVRLAADRAWLTVKGESRGVTRVEFEYEVPPEHAEAMLHLAVSSLTKTRYRVMVGEHVWDVDEFHGALEGMVLAEVELTREDEPFERPAWVTHEVSGDARFFNSALARASAPLNPLGDPS